MKCKNCNSEIKEGSLKCEVCGSNINEEVLETFSHTGDTSSEEVFSIDGSSSLNEVETFVYDNKPKKKSVIPFIGVIAAVVLLLGAGFLVYLRILPKLAFESVIEQSIKKFEKGMGFGYDTSKTEFDLKFKINGSKVQDDYLSIINKLSVSGKVENDYKNNKSFISIDTKYNKEDLVKTDLFINNDTTYIYFKDIYDKYIKYDMEDANKQQNLTKDYEVLTRKIVEQIKKALKIDYFKRKNDGEFVKNILTLTDKELYDVFKSVLDNLVKDDDFLNSLSNITLINKADLIDYMNGSIGDYNFTNEESLSIELYSRKGSEKVERIVLRTDEDDDADLEIEVSNDNSYVIKIKTGVNEIIYKVNFSKSGDKDKLNFEVFLGDYSFSAELVYAVKYNEHITVPDVKNVIDYKSIDQSDQEKILLALMKNSGAKKLLEDTGFLSNEYSYDNTYDTSDNLY